MRRGGETLATILRARASAAPDRTAIRFRAGDGWVSWTWGEFLERALSAAAGLSAAGLGVGDRALLLVPEVENAVAVLFGAWALGVVPVPVGVPYRLDDVGQFIDGLRGTARRMEAKALITSAALASFASDNDGLRVLPAEDIAAGERSLRAVEMARGEGAPALIQLTSGSTGQPRGVVLAHDRLLTHMEQMRRGLPSHAESVAVSWLPLHHDMGLIGGLLFPFYNDFPAHMLSPQEFRARPLSWLAAMSEVRGTICAAPPSAYAIALRLAKRAAEAGLRFDAWECAMVGAEPISPSLLRRFADAFAPMGFRAEAFFPVYGLAEATVAVSFPGLLSPARTDVVDREALSRFGVARACAAGAGAVEIAGVGAPIPETVVRVIAEDGQELPDRVVGEITVRAPSLMCGYFGDPEATGEALREGWLYTGDLGYVADGCLFVTGRKKDVIIRGGQNLSPAMIEEIAGEVPGVRAGCVAAVGVRSEEDETEKCHVLVESKVEPREHAALSAAVAEALGARGIFVDRVHVVTPGTLLRTTSGKIRRGPIREALSGRG
ncbi:MAG: AMP-binding protein [Polyangiaceae bacterium]